MSAGFVISAEMARRKDLGCAAKLVYAYACRYVMTDDRETGKPNGLAIGEVWLRQRKRSGDRPGVDEALGLSHGAVERAIKDLTDAGLMIAVRTPTPAERRSGNVTVYALPEYSPRNGDRPAEDHAPEWGSYSPRNGDRTAPETGTTCSGDSRSSDPVENTPPTPLTEGGAIEVIEGTIEDEGSTTPDPLRGYRWSGALTRRGGAPTERERAQAEEVFEAWVESPTLIGGRRRGAARLDGKRMEAIVQRLRDGYEVADLADACRGWTRIPHNRGDGTDTRGQKFDSLTMILRNADQVDRFLSAWRDPVDEAAAMERAALARQAVRNPMLAAAKAIAPAGMERAPEHHPAVKDALDAATLRWREDEIRAGRDAREHMPEEMRRQVIEEAVAALAVPC